MMGIDSEAYNTGEPFLIMVSTGKEVNVTSVLMSFFDEVPDGELTKKEKKRLSAASKYLDRHYGTYNLKYDSGALLYYVQRENLMELWKYGRTRIEIQAKTEKKTFTIEYIPHKFLSFQHKGFFIKIWDVAQYFKMSLDKACMMYLGKKMKLDIETKTFTRPYVKQNLAKIKKYCLVDSQACAELGNYLISKLKAFGIKTTSLYSPASLSYEYFSTRCHIVVIKRLWKYYKDIIHYAMESYKGGKFECTARGSFPEAWQYDIVSAYPYEISRLLNIEKARFVFSNEYIPEADYGFLRVMIYNDNHHIPCAVKNRARVDIYPYGKFFTTITKQEYDYLNEIGCDCRIISAWWIVCKSKVTPYKDCIDELFAIKARFKGRDDFLYSVSKLMMNSFYGKTLQLIKDIVPDTDKPLAGGKFAEKTIYRAGRPFNPVHGAVVTANTRIKITRIQNLMKEKCLAVHTDSALCLEPLPPELVTGALGDLELQKHGSGVLIACGQYQIDSADGKSKGAYKGFRPDYEDDWIGMLKRNKEKSTFEQKTLHVEGWYECCAKGHFDRVNLFQNDKKIIDLNADTKRLWQRQVKAKHLLAGIEQSAPQVVMNIKKPLNW